MKDEYKTKSLEYKLPAELYAREPLDKNEANSRMAVGYKEKDEFIDSNVKDISKFLKKGDLLVLNNSMTIPPIFEVFSKEEGYFNVHLTQLQENEEWICTLDLLRDDIKNILGKKLITEDGLLEAIVHENNGTLVINFNKDKKYVFNFLLKYGTPVQSAYVKKRYGIKEYQNDIGSVEGSLENPAANQHFNHSLLKSLKKQGINVAFVTLHCVSESAYIDGENILDHKVDPEYFEIPVETAKLIEQVKKNGKRVFAIGTTSARTLESVEYDRSYHIVSKLSGFTNLAIYPGYKFKVLNGIVTNFHGSRSSRLALAAAFIGVNKIMDLYKFAIQKKYHFYEFGDACFLINKIK